MTRDVRTIKKRWVLGVGLGAALALFAPLAYAGIDNVVVITIGYESPQQHNQGAGSAQLETFNNAGSSTMHVNVWQGGGLRCSSDVAAGTSGVCSLNPAFASTAEWSTQGSAAGKGEYSH